jgi:hypothetical protein
MKYITMNGDVYIKTERLTFRRFAELIVTKCRQLYVSAYSLLRIGGL